jgi:hypothetical protein
MPNMYAPPPAGMIWVPTPTGHQAMTLEQARAYLAPRAAQGRAAGGLTLDTINSPDLSPALRQRLQDPRVLAAMQGGQTTDVKVGDTTFTIENGVITHQTTGGWKKPVALALATAAGGYFGGQLLGGAGATGAGGAAASTTAPVTAGGAGAGTAGGASVGGALGSDIALEAEAGLHGGTAAGGGFGGWVRGAGGILGSAGGRALASAGGQLGAAALESRGRTHAAEIEAQTAREALAYEKERDAYLRNLEASRYAELSGRLEPYIATGQSASDRMARLMGLDTRGYGYTPPLPGVQPGMGRAAVPAAAMAAGPAPSAGYSRPVTPGVPVVGTAVPRPAGTTAGGLVTVRAPTGEQRRLSPEMAQRAVSLGAQIVGG